MRERFAALLMSQFGPRCQDQIDEVCSLSTSFGITHGHGFELICRGWTQSRHWMFGRIFGLDGRESYRELRLEPLCCPHRLSRGTAPHERDYPRRKDRF
jgi:hypothetical protein